MKRIALKTTQTEQLIDITDAVNEAVASIGDGYCTALVFCPHTTAGITVNEAADPDVAVDLLAALQRMVPEQFPWRHGEGNSPAHVKACLVGCSVILPVKDGAMDLGRWQGIFFCEFDGPRSRDVLVQTIA